MFELSKAVVYELPDPGVYNHPPRRGTIGYARCGGTIGSLSTLLRMLGSTEVVFYIVNVKFSSV